ncbi:hypothetical protein [Mycoplasmopsis agassizii]|uniref:Transposase n=1 Tax=Mycoplasmopsis agassizii TaxID=33922 RepID=A0ABX4H5T7_9BACT|nr:hypothetical protein [Mycoplasmopsis agassizii]PAF55235.1 hypothetical protein CJF60_00925 [Mycoplasmopsis agassizii]SMC15654.1 hypothetical protein SAMN02745179_00003 [Mycoplasmopsis agassizii]
MAKDKNENKILKAIKKIKALPRTLKAIRDIISWIFKYYEQTSQKAKLHYLLMLHLLHMIYKSKVIWKNLTLKQFL